MDIMVHHQNGRVWTRLYANTSPRTTNVRNFSRWLDSEFHQAGSENGAHRFDLLPSTFAIVSIAILSGYFGIYVLVKIVSAFSKKKPVEEKVAVVADTTESSGIPAVESSAFEKFVETVAFEKLLENESQLSKLLESA